MRKMSNVKFGVHDESGPFESKVASRARLNLNDLLSRRKEEKKVEKKTTKKAVTKKTTANKATTKKNTATPPALAESPAKKKLRLLESNSSPLKPKAKRRRGMSVSEAARITESDADGFVIINGRRVRMLATPARMKKKKRKPLTKDSDINRVLEENERLRKENDLLKKWQQYLAEQHQNGLDSSTDSEKN